MDLASIVFWSLALVIIGSALAVVFLKNIVHSALALIVTFIGVAGIFLTLHAEFMAAIQIIVYAGAISILTVFGIMLITKGDGQMDQTNLFGKFKYPAALVVALFTGAVSYLILLTPWQGSTEKNISTMSEIAQLIFFDFVIAFELVGILLTVAMVAAIIIARGVKKSG